MASAGTGKERKGKGSSHCSALLACSLPCCHCQTWGTGIGVSTGAGEDVQQRELELFYGQALAAQEDPTVLCLIQSWGSRWDELLSEDSISLSGPGKMQLKGGRVKVAGYRSQPMSLSAPTLTTHLPIKMSA